MQIQELSKHEGAEVELKGWVSNKRTGKGLAFIILRDGSGFIQCVVDEANVTGDELNEAQAVSLESSVSLKGNVIKDERQIGGYELSVNAFKLISKAEEYPISKKEHGVEFLMEHRHLWLRSKKQWANMRIRNVIIYAMHRYFQDKGFVQMDAPIFTGNACEGTTTLFSTEYYGEEAYLSQSGQLYGEAMAMAMGKIYTFGPTFRAEKSKTRRHLSEFWMIEPEMAFYDLDMNMDLIEDFIRFLVKEVLKQCKQELEILERDTSYLEKTSLPFPRITYSDAVLIIKGEKEVSGKNSISVLENDLKQAKQRLEDIDSDISEREALVSKGGIKKGKLNFLKNKIAQLFNEKKNLEELCRNIPQWTSSAKNFKHGSDFGGSDETVLTRLYETPLMVYNWPKDIKAFYMKECEDDSGYVKGVDLLAPEGYGEIIGGAEREVDLEILKQKIKEHNLPMEAFEWYLDLRRYGSVPHAGFGIGLERFVSWVTGIKHVRESIPFPRMYGHLFP
ncbi:MAG TPA: asparagine--tRNA ligase [Bacteroidetes bacterium]|nr:asparagine--tRNA ligase [Bacteroidota bacterium]